MLDIKYKEKEIKYYGNSRIEILPLIPRHVNQILDIGCGSGDTLNFLKQNSFCNSAIGVEYFSEAANIAEGRVDRLYRSNIEDMNLDIKAGSIDVILCLDILEHLVNPQLVVQYLHTLLAPGGCIIASIPNVRNFTVSIPLLFKNEWTYTNNGILDNTHLRFFVRDTAIQLMQSSGLILDSAVGINLGRKGRLLNKIFFGKLESLVAVQYLIKVRKPK